MHIKTNITKADILRLNLYMMFRSKGNLYAFIILFFLILMLVYLNPPENEDANMLAIILGALFAAVLGFAAGMIVSIVCILCASTEKSGVLGEHEFFVLPEGLQEKTKANETLTKWNGVKTIRKTKSFILVQINGYLFHIIPKRSFEDDVHFEKFWNEIASYNKAAQ